MTLGEKIKEYRLLHNMTQKELGIKVGFSTVTADTRIRQYEKDTMAPKSEIRNKLIQALDVDPSALSEIDIRSNEVDKENHVFDITLRLTVTTKIAEDKVAFLCEVNQAALVHIENLQDQQLGHALNATVPSILFPYARENISSLVSKAGFPPFILQPLNFDAIYMQRLQQEAQAAQEAPKAAE